MKKYCLIGKSTIVRGALLASAAWLTAALPGAAQAQISTGSGAATTTPAAAEPELAQEILVTATRREERLIDVPVSIQTLSGEELGKTGAVNFADYARLIAGVSFLDAGPGRSQIFIRGVSTGGDVDTGKESTVGVYIDETPVTEGSSQPDLKLYDIDRIEVLRGPQGSLYGSGSLGGAVRILTNQPRFDDTTGYLQLTGSTTRHGGENVSANSWINLPLGDKVAVRAVGYALHNAGFLDNGFSGEKNINDEDTYGGRVALRVRPSDNLNVVLTGYYQKTEIGAYNRATDEYPSLIINQSVPEPFDDRSGVVNLKLDLDLEFATLTSSSSYFDRRRHFENDIDYFLGSLGAPSGLSELTYDATSKVQELRLASTGNGSFRWLIGGFYLDRSETFHQTINFRALPPPTSQGANIFFENSRTTTKQYAAFGELSYDLLSNVTATVGLRVSQTDRDAVQVNDGVFLGGFSRAEGDFSESSTTPKFNLSFKPTDDSLLYIQAAKGFRIGGINPGLPPCGSTCVVDVEASFGSDSLWNYEVGAKFQLFDRALSLTASAFRIDWKDIQLNVNRGDGFNGFMNAGSARSEGFEVEANARVGEHLRLGGQVTYTDAELRKVRPGVAVASPGMRLPDVARWTASANTELGTAFGQNGYAYMRADLQYVGPRPSELGPTSLPVDDYTLLNVRVGLDTGPYQFSLFVNNLTDERAQLSRTQLNGVLGGAPVVLDRVTINVPRTIGISIARSF